MNKVSFSSLSSNDHQCIHGFLGGLVFATINGYFLFILLTPSKNSRFWSAGKTLQSFVSLFCKKFSSSTFVTLKPLTSIIALNAPYQVLCSRGFLPFQIITAFSPFYFQFLRCPYRKVLVHMRDPDLWPF